MPASAKIKGDQRQQMKFLNVIRSMATVALELTFPRQKTHQAPEEVVNDPLSEEVIEIDFQAKKPEHDPQQSKEELTSDEPILSNQVSEKTWDQAAKELKTSKRPGKVVRTIDGYEVEYHDHWRDEHEAKKKEMAEERLLRKQRAIKDEEERKEKAYLYKAKIQKEKEEVEARRFQEEEERKLQIQKIQEDLINKEKEKAKILAAWELIQKEKKKEAKQAVVRGLVGNNVTIIAQYRHPGSSSEKFSEWGAWAIVENENYSIYHESEDRVTYGKREKIVKVNSREEAIKYCEYLVSKGWYRDTQLFEADQSTEDFPQPPIPTEEQRNQARREFKRWKDIAAQPQEHEDIPF